MAAIAIPLDHPVRAPRRAAAPVVVVSTPPVTEETYRRRQLVAFAVAILLVIAALVAAKAAMGGSTSALQPIARSVYVVQPGDTLWEIARALQPTGDVRPLVGKLADQRGGAPLQVGERIALP
jgi:LysM repeat protein